MHAAVLAGLLALREGGGAGSRTRDWEVAPHLPPTSPQVSTEASRSLMPHMAPEPHMSAEPHRIRDDGELEGEWHARALRQGNEAVVAVQQP